MTVQQAFATLGRSTVPLIAAAIVADLGIDLPDYSGPFKPDLRFTDFSRDQLVRMLDMCDEYRHVWVGAWLDEVENYFGRTVRLDIEWIAWRDVLAPSLRTMLP